MSSGQAFLPSAAPATFTLDVTGDYTWEMQFSNGVGSISRLGIHLAAGDYSWQCEVSGTGKSSAADFNYQSSCWLKDDSAPSNPPAYMPNPEGTWNGFDEVGTYTWYMSLQSA